MANYVIDDMWHPHMHAVFGALVPLYTPWYVCGIQLVLFHQFLRILSIKFVYIDSGDHCYCTAPLKTSRRLATRIAAWCIELHMGYLF